MPRRDVDVLLPVRDALPTLPEALADILAQVDVALRVVVVVDTGGTCRDDGSGAWLAARAAVEPRLLVLPNAGAGLTAALVTGLAACDAQFVAHMEADDRCPPQRLARLLAALRGSEACGGAPLAGVVSRASAFGSPSPGMERWLAWQNDLLSGPAMAAERFVEIPALQQTGLYRRDALLALGGFATAGPWPADIDFWLRWFEAGLPVAKLPETLYHWRQHGKQSSRAGGEHAPERLRAARLHYLVRLHGRRGLRPRALRLVSTGATLATWERELRTRDVDLRDARAWRPGQPPPPRPAADELLLAVYGTAPARDALRRVLPGVPEPDALLFAG